MPWRSNRVAQEPGDWIWVQISKVTKQTKEKSGMKKAKAGFDPPTFAVPGKFATTILPSHSDIECRSFQGFCTSRTSFHLSAVAFGFIRTLHIPQDLNDELNSQFVSTGRFTFNEDKGSWVVALKIRKQYETPVIRTNINK
jgi:hypothetical protein